MQTFLDSFSLLFVKKLEGNRGRYQGRAGQLLADFFPLYPVTFPEVFSKVNSAQMPVSRKFR